MPQLHMASLVLNSMARIYRWNLKVGICLPLRLSSGLKIDGATVISIMEYLGPAPHIGEGIPTVSTVQKNTFRG